MFARLLVPYAIIHARVVSAYLTTSPDVSNIRYLMSGLDLKLKRTAQRVRVSDLARVMGVTHSRVSQIEALSVVTQRTAARYLAALATFPVGSHNGERAA